MGNNNVISSHQEKEDREGKGRRTISAALPNDVLGVICCFFTIPQLFSLTNSISKSDRFWTFGFENSTFWETIFLNGCRINSTANEMKVNSPDSYYYNSQALQPSSKALIEEALRSSSDKPLQVAFPNPLSHRFSMEAKSLMPSKITSAAIARKDLMATQRGGEVVFNVVHAGEKDDFSRVEWKLACGLLCPPRVYLWDEVVQHKSSSSSEKDRGGGLWIVIHGTVYDVTKFLPDHPGGEDIIMDFAGKRDDAGTSFDEIGHSDTAVKMLKRYRVGELVQNGRLAAKEAARKKRNARVYAESKTRFVPFVAFSITLAVVSVFLATKK